MDNISEAEISMVLDTYMYLNYTAPDGMLLQDIIEALDKNASYQGTVANCHPNEMSVLRQAVKNPQIGTLEIVNQSQNMGYDAGTNAITFRKNGENTVYVAYRGTFDGEWLDNGNGLTQEETIQQKRATNYFDSMVSNGIITEDDRVIVTGHSKGGNKAQFVTMNTQYGKYIDVCYSIDGQGHSESAITAWKRAYGPEEYTNRVNKIYGINGENDFVSVLGNCIIPMSHIMYVKTGADCSDFVAYHDITRMFAQYSKDENGNSLITFNGRKNPYVFTRGELGNLVEGLSDDIMELPDERLDGNATTLMQIAEAAMGEKKIGLNGERMHADDLMDFTSTGLGRILRRVFFTTQGATFLSKLSASEQLSRDYGPEDTVLVNYNKLFEEADKLTAFSSYLGGLLLELEVTGLQLPFYLDGIVIRKGNIQEQIAKMYFGKKQIENRSNVLRTIAQLYQNYDASLEIV